MLMYSRHRGVYRVFCALTLVLVLPAWIQLGELLSPAAWAAPGPDSQSTKLTPLQLALLSRLATHSPEKGKEEAAPTDPAGALNLAKATNLPVKDSTVNVTTPKYWTRVARLLPEKQGVPEQDIDQILAKAYVIRSPKARQSAPDIRRYRPKAVDEPDTAAEPTEATSEAAEPAPDAATAPEPSAGLPADAAATVQLGDAYLEANRLREAAEQFFTVVNEWPDSPESDSCDNVMNALAWDVERNAVDLAEMRRFVDELPQTSDCKSDKAVYWVIAAQQMAGENLAKAGAARDAQAYLERARDGAATAMRERPDSPYQIFLPGHYLRACRIMGKLELAAGVETLKRVVQAQKTRNVLKFAARLELAMSHHKDSNDITEGLLQCANILDEFPGSQTETIVKADAGVSANLQAHLNFGLGYVHFQMSHFGAARRIFDGIAAQHSEDARMCEASMYMSAFLTELLHAREPQAGIDAYSAFIGKSQGSDFLAMALGRLSAIYDRNGQLSQAAVVLRRMVELFPDKEWSANASRAAAEHEAAVKAGMEEKLAAERLRGEQGETLCGPVALALLLASQGIHSDILALARQAGSDTNGTTLGGLREAAGALGVGLSGVRTADVKVSPPAIAYLEPDHFVFVSTVDERGVTIEDATGQRIMPLADFTRACSQMLV